MPVPDGRWNGAVPEVNFVHTLDEANGGIVDEANGGIVDGGQRRYPAVTIIRVLVGEYPIGCNEKSFILLTEAHFVHMLFEANGGA